MNEYIAGSKEEEGLKEKVSEEGVGWIPGEVIFS